MIFRVFNENIRLGCYFHNTHRVENVALMQMEQKFICWTESELHAEIALLSPTAVIAIDGLNGAGKSWIAERIASKFGWKLIKCDDFIKCGQLPYPNVLDLHALRQALDQQSGKTTVVDSVCLKSILKAIGISAAHHIYVRKRNPDRSLVRSEFYEAFNPAEMIASAKEICCAMGDEEPVLDLELVIYHRDYRPLESASIVFENLIGIEVI